MLRRSDGDRVAVIAAGITLFEALAAYEELKKEGQTIRVIDLYWVKPIDTATLKQALDGVRAVITVEDHHPEGGLGEAVTKQPCRREYPGLLPRGEKSPEEREAGGASRLRRDFQESHSEKSEGAVMRPQSLATRIFLDGGNPDETKELIDFLGFLDGQTTNPTLISKNPGVRERLEKGGKFSKEKLTDYYREVVKKISAMIPQGSISVEVYADPSTRADEMLRQGREMFGWIPNAHIKFPTSAEGLKAASQAIKSG